MAPQEKISKARGDSKLDTLPDGRVAELRDGMIAGWTYQKARDWLWVECGVKVSLSAFTPFYRRHVEPVLREQKQFAALSAKTVTKLAQESDLFDEAAIVEFKEYAYQLMRSPDGDPEEKRKWMEALIKERADRVKAEQAAKKLAQSDKALDQDDRRIRLLEEKAAEAKAKLLALTSSAASRGGLTPETLKEIEEAAGLL